MMVKGDWAFVNGMLQQPGGKPLDKTKFVDNDYLQHGKEGLFDDNFQAILQKKKGIVIFTPDGNSIISTIIDSIP